MFSNSTKPIAAKAGRPAALPTTRNATAARGLNASRGLPGDAREYSQPAQPSVAADQIGTAVTLLLSLALMAGGSLMVAQIWAHLAMVR
jgi:hypothetical protein